MIIIRWIATLLIGHVSGALIVGVSTAGGVHGVTAGVFFAVVGCFYLLIEAPFVLIGQILAEQCKTRISRSLLLVVIPSAGAAIGYLFCFKEAGIRPSDYAIGYSIAGAVIGALVIGSSLMFPIHYKVTSIKEQTNSAPE